MVRFAQELNHIIQAGHIVQETGIQSPFAIENQHINHKPQDGKQFGVILFASIAMILGVAKTFRIHKNIETVARCVTQTLVRKVDAKASCMRP